MEQICDSLFERCIQPFKNCLKDADLTSAQIDELVLVGGMTRMPKVVDIAKTLGGKPPHQGVNPDESSRSARRSRAASSKGDVATSSSWTDPADARHHDGGRRVHRDDPAQHHQSPQEDPDVLDLQ